MARIDAPLQVFHLFVGRVGRGLHHVVRPSAIAPHRQFVLGACGFDVGFVERDVQRTHTHVRKPRVRRVSMVDHLIGAERPLARGVASIPVTDNVVRAVEHDPDVLRLHRPQFRNAPCRRLNAVHVAVTGHLGRHVQRLKEEHRRHDRVGRVEKIQNGVRHDLLEVARVLGVADRLPQVLRPALGDNRSPVPPLAARTLGDVQAKNLVRAHAAVALGAHERRLLGTQDERRSLAAVTEPLGLRHFRNSDGRVEVVGVIALAFFQQSTR